MRSFIPALIGLATVAVAQNSTESCISAYVSCYDFDSSNANVCSSQAAACKDRCSTANSNCLSSGVSANVCAQRHATCLGATSTTNTAISCISEVIPCYESSAHDDTHTCDSLIGNCKDACTAINDICNSTSDDNSEVCNSLYSACLGADKVTTPSTSCIAQAETCYNNNTADNTCGANTATCKQTCGVLKDACMTSGDDSQCQSAYLSCLGSDNPGTSSVDCISEAETCYQSGEADNSCDASNAQCKDFCSNVYDTCNSSGDNSTACLSYYSSCLGSSKVSSSAIDCVASTEACYLSGNVTDAKCDEKNGLCKTQCSREYSTCLSSGDESVKEQCATLYQSCLGSTKLTTSTVDCVTRNEQCYLNGTPDAECDSQNAICKSVCSRVTDTCLSSNDSSVALGCYGHYNQCLGATNVSSTSSVNCVEDATECFLYGTADNNCSASTATCKSSCSRTYDTCLSSGDDTIKSGCLLNYDSCLGATQQAEEAASSINCISRYTSCFSSGIAENECSRQNAQCKNTCSQLLDSCASSGDNTTQAQCQGVYNACLGSIATSLVDYKPLDCAGRSKQCAYNGTADNECDRQQASCTNACATTLDTCLTSGSSDSAACNHLYLICLDAGSYTATSIPASLNPTSTRASVSFTNSANATTGHVGPTAAANGTSVGAVSPSASVTSSAGFANPTAGASSGFGATTTVSRAGAFGPGPYQNGTSVSSQAVGSDKTTKTTAVESTVYVTDVVKTTVTTCPVGQTLTTAGKTTVLTTPSVITSTYTVKSTVSTTKAVTETASQPASSPVNAQNTQTAPKESTVYVTDVVKTTVTTCPVGQTLTTAGKTTVLTTPSVITSTFTVKSTVSTTQAVTETASKSASSPANPEQTTTAPVAGHVAIPSTVILYSTAIQTVTSCGSEVTNCPARSTVVSTSLVPTGITVSQIWSRTSAAPSSSQAGAASGSAPASSVQSTVIVTDVVKSTVTTCPVGQTLTTSGTTVVLTTPSAITNYETVFVKSTIPASQATVSPSSPVAAVPASSKASSAVQSAPQGSAPASSPVAGVPQASVPVSSAPVVPTTAPYGLTNGTMTVSFATGSGAVGTGSKTSATQPPLSTYTGAANKAGVAGLAGVAALFAFLL